jgi:uncharacterized protein YbaP (TraB family)
MRIKTVLIALLSFWVTFGYAQKNGKPVDGIKKTNAALTANNVELRTKPVNKNNSLLWEITGNGLETPSYLFGTIHIIAEDDYFWTDIMEEKFQASELLVLEIDIENPMMMMMSMMGSMTMKDGMTLKKLLTEAEYKQVDEYFTANLGMSVSMFNRFKPIFTSMIISQIGAGGEGGGMGMEGSKSYEMELVEKAKQRELEVEGLETAEYQMSMFDSIPYTEQAEMLMQAVNGEGDSSDDTMDEMIELYKKQDLEGLYKMISGSEDLGEYEDVLLVTRNKNWIPKINEFAKEKSTFVAVGAGHLPGENGVINLLKKEGYTVKPLK